MRLRYILVNAVTQQFLCPQLCNVLILQRLQRYCLQSTAAHCGIAVEGHSMETVALLAMFPRRPQLLNGVSSMRSLCGFTCINYH